MKKLHRHHHDSESGSPVVSGIFSGLGEWMEVSPGVLRVGYIALTILTGILPGLLLYLIMHFLIPRKR